MAGAIQSTGTQPPSAPLVDDKYTDPDTGFLQSRGDRITYSPPTIDLLFVNLTLGEVNATATTSPSPPPFTMHRFPHPGPLGKLFVQVAKGVEEGLCELHSVSASEYGMTVVVKSALSAGEFKGRLNEVVFV
jgi:hypothetical protein